MVELSEPWPLAKNVHSLPVTIDEQLAILRRGAAEIISEDELRRGRDH